MALAIRCERARGQLPRAKSLARETMVDGKGLTPRASSIIVRAMNDHNLICGFICREIIR